MTRIVLALAAALLGSAPVHAASPAVRERLTQEVFADCDAAGRGVLGRDELVACMGRDDIASARQSIASAGEAARVATSLVVQSGGSARRQSLIDMLSGAGLAADLLDRIPSREGDVVNAEDVEAARSAAMAELRDALMPRMEAAAEAADGVMETLGTDREGRVVRRPKAARER